MEEWKEIESKGVPLFISTLGRVKAPERQTEYTRVRSGKEQTFIATIKERFPSVHLDMRGYPEVRLLHDGKRKHHHIHQMVAKAFCPGYEPSLTVNHINGIKTDNRVENLEWISLAANTEHQWATGLVDLRGEAHPGAILTSKRVYYIRKLLRQGIPAHTIAIVAGVSSSLIDLIRDGKRWAQDLDA